MNEIVLLVHIQLPAMERAEVTELDGEEKAVRPPAIPAETGLSLEDHRLLCTGFKLRGLTLYTALS